MPGKIVAWIFDFFGFGELTSGLLLGSDFCVFFGSGADGDGVGSFGFSLTSFLSNSLMTFGVCLSS